MGMLANRELPVEDDGCRWTDLNRRISCLGTFTLSVFVMHHSGTNGLSVVAVPSRLVSDKLEFDENESDSLLAAGIFVLLNYTFF